MSDLCHGRPGMVSRPAPKNDVARTRLWARVSSALRDVLPLAILAVAVVGVPVLVFEPQGLPRLRSLERDLEQVEAENKAAEREIARLRQQVKLLKDDLATVEKVARQELGLVRKSEIVLQLPKATNQN
jgi:cell division protein FtsB